MSADPDLVVIGAGPAGLAAATRAGALGLRVVLVDEQPAPGGQIYRACERKRSAVLSKALGPSYEAGAELVARFRASGCEYRPGLKVWQLEEDGRVYVSDGERAEVINGRHAIVAIGAVERPVPVPGWTLPGVMTVGAAQTLFKVSGLVPAEGVWIAGSGPLVWLFAAQLVAAGGRPAGILDTASPAARWAALKHVGGAWAGRGLIARGLHYRKVVREAGVPIVPGVDGIEAVGDARVRRVRYRVGGRWHAQEVAGLLLHEGVIPNAHMAMSAGVEHDWDDSQCAFRARRDELGRTNLGAISVAGDCGGIFGAESAALQGELAALGAARALGVLDAAAAEREASTLRERLEPFEAFRRFLDTLFAPRPALLEPADDVIVCRCESVRAGDIRKAVQAGGLGPNQIKAFTRCGMGPCQGRTCHTVLAATIAAARHVAPREVELVRIRPPLKPITLGELASLATREMGE